MSGEAVPRTVLFRLEAPLQAYGTGARFEVRTSGREPAKSAVVGMICNALGLAPGDEATIARIARLDLAVRVDREGGLVRDYQTAGGGTFPGRDEYGVVNNAGRNVGTVQTERYYLSDASFLCALGGDDREMVDRIAAGLVDPVGAVFLGRLACAPSRSLRPVAVDLDPIAALRAVPWTPRPNQRARAALRTVVEGGPGDDPRWDHPISFELGRREHGLRHVRQGAIPVASLPPGGPPASRTPDSASEPPATTPYARPAARGAGAGQVVRRIRQLATDPDRARRAADRCPVYLSQLVLDQEHARVIRDVSDAHDMHRTLLHVFPPPEDWSWPIRKEIDPREAGRAYHGILHRIDRDPKAGLVLLVQSATRPDWDRLPAGYIRGGMTAGARIDRVDGVWSAIRPGDLFAFCLRVIWRGRRGEDGRGRGREDRGAEDARLEDRAWILGVGPSLGFELVALDKLLVEPAEIAGGEGRRAKGAIEVAPVRLVGRLRVKDEARLRAAMRDGVGRCKAYGCGLFSLHPVRA